jgi:hypothetical protein
MLLLSWPKKTIASLDSVIFNPPFPPFTGACLQVGFLPTTLTENSCFGSTNPSSHHQSTS